MKLLLVEDDMEISQMLKDYLRAENYEVVCAADGEEASEKFDSDSYALVLLDLMIPKISGMEVMQHIRQSSTVPIIIVSEIESIADTVGVINHGVLMKEVTMKEISEMSLAYIELNVINTKKASYVLADKMGLDNFKIVEDGKIRIYDHHVSTQELSKVLALNDVEIVAIGKKAESLEDYFLKMTAEV